MHKTIVSIFVATLFFTNSIFASKDLGEFRFEVTRHVLPNGLTVLLHEDHSVPMISYQTWFRVGSRDEEPGFTGIAHLFEHMMFKGAKRYSGKEMDRILTANGIMNNAFTTHDYTGYYEDGPSNKLELIIDVESDRMENLVLTEAGLKSEREVVKEERRMRVENSIAGTMNENFWGTAFTVHPYKWPVVGYMKDLDAITVEKCREFYRMYYSPANAVVVLVGDFNSDYAMKLIRKYYEPLRKVDVQRRPIPQEPPQDKQRTGKVAKKAESQKIMLGWHGSQHGTNDSYALDLVNNILVEGPSSRLYRHLVYDKQWATSVAGFNPTPKDPGLFSLFFELKPGIKPEAVLSLTDYEIRNFEKNVTPKELEKAKNQIMKSWVDSVSTVSGKARSLAINEVVAGSYEVLFDDLKRYQAVTLADLKKVTEKYLTKSNQTVLTLEDNKTPSNQKKAGKK